MNTTQDLPGSDMYADDSALLAYLRQLEQDERIREYSEEI